MTNSRVSSSVDTVPPSEMIPEEVSGDFDRVEEVVEAYQRCLDDPAVLSDAARSEFKQKLLDRGMVFGGRILSPFLRPNFLTRRQFKYVQDTIKEIMAAIHVVEERMRVDPAVVEQVGVPPAEEELLRSDPSDFPFSLQSRMDTFLTRLSFKCVEYNAESPAGIGYGDVLQEIYAGFPPFKRLSEKVALSPLMSREKVRQTMLDAWRRWGGQGLPSIGIVDFDHVPTVTEFVMFREYFESHGMKAVVAAPRELEFRNGRLMANDFPIDLLYRRVLVNELLERYDECKALVDAVRARAVCMVNSFRCKLLHKKLLFAILWSPSMQQYFTARMRETVQRHIPWTCRVVDGRVDRKGESIDLMEFARREQQRLVLKPNDEYGGKGVIIGWERTPAQWEEALQDALTYPHILQEQVPVARDEFPDLEMNTAPRIVDLDPFIFGDETTGFLTRLSDTSLCNVTSGGGQTPTFIIED